MTTHAAGPGAHRVLNAAALRGWPLPQAGGDADKEQRGHVLVIAGSREIPGAALLAATAALRAGAGKLTIATVQGVAPGLALMLPEARVIGLPEGDDGGLLPEGVERLHACLAGPAAVLAGPGLQGAASTGAFMTALLAVLPKAGDVPCIFDALAMDVLLQRKPLSQPVLITPHAGEMAHLTGLSKDEVQGDPLGAACRLADQAKLLVALKGAETFLVTPQQASWCHRAAIPGLATSGSGDVLAGIMAGLASRGAPLVQAAAWAIVIHARAGRRLALRHGDIGYLARELLDEIPAAMRSI